MYHSMTIAGLERKLPLCRLNDDLKIAAFVTALITAKDVSERKSSTYVLLSYLIPAIKSINHLMFVIIVPTKDSAH